jgi:ketosteroid isomerase-like protein
MNAEYLIREYFKAYHARARNALESLLSDDFAFCSPLDDNISKDQYLKTCWPNSERQLNHLIEKLFVEGNEALATYECERTDGTKFRNTEFFRTEGDKITHVDVYFGLGTAPTWDQAGKRAD